MNKTLRAFVLPFALFFTLSTVTAPARAVLPLIASGVAFISEGSVAANGIAALTVGTVAGMIYLGNLQSGTGANDGSGSFMEVPLGIYRSRPQEIPPGYSAPAQPGTYISAQPVPPSTVSFSSLGYQYGTNPIVSTPLGACTSVNAAATIVTPVNITTHPYSYNCQSTGGANFNVAEVIGCGSGYTLSGFSCALSNAAAVMKPANGRCQILMGVSGFVIDPQDPECGDLAANTGTTVAPTTVTVNKPGALSNGEIKINADGSRTVTYKTSNVTNNTTTITTVNLTPTSDGQNAIVSGNSTTVVAGTGTAAGSTPAAPAAPTINIPTDYNREATQQQIKSSVDTLHGDMDSSAFSQPAASAVPADLASAENKKITDELAASVAAYDNFKMLDWSTWIPTFPAASCSPFTGGVLGRSVSIDLCPKIAMLNELIGWMLAVFASWSVVSMMFRKD